MNMTTMPATLVTRFVPYRFGHFSEPGYQAIVRERKAAGIEHFGNGPTFSSTNNGKKVDLGHERDVSLETKHIFGNQWNTAPDEYSPLGFRLFNWTGSIVHHYGESCRHGHYLVITEEMLEVCRLTHKCGYCAGQYFGLENAGKFCSACLDNEHLKETDLCLLRLMPVDINGHVPERCPLTDEERGELLPRYVHAQTVATGSRAVARKAKARQDVLDKCDKACQAALAERGGMVWLLDRGIPIDNVIYYSHTKKFCFGWRTPLGPTVREALVAKLEGFPYEVEFKGQ